MAQIGKLEGFYCITCDVDTYFERLASYFKANRVAADARIDTFISVAGEKTYKLMKSLLAPEKPKDKSLDDIKKLLQEHMQPKESIICRRAKFYSRKQGVCESMEVGYGDSKHQLELLVANVSGQPPILGRDWLAQIHLDWKSFPHQLSQAGGCLGEAQRSFPGWTPKVMKARPVPYALRPMVEEQLDNLEKEGVIVKTMTSKWATPIVVVPNKNGIRICGDYKVTLNPQLQVDKYPLPRPVDLFATLSGGPVLLYPRPQQRIPPDGGGGTHHQHAQSAL